MEPIKIKSLDEFVKKICKFKNSSDAHFNRNIYLFRGQSNIDYKLVPSLQRYKESIDGNNERSCILERNLIEMAKNKLSDVFKNHLRPIELLSLLQHYGIPTRLLDVTENALVALYFACASNWDKDGEVFVFLSKEDDVTPKPIIELIANSYTFLRDCSHPIIGVYLDLTQEKNVLTQEKNPSKWNKKLKELLKNSERIVDMCKQPFFIYSPNRTMRQQIQCGRYILFPNHIGKFEGEYHFFLKIDPLPKDHEYIKMRICIPADKKEQILNNLKMFGISKGILFGDSVDKVCEEIKDSFR